MHEIFNYTLAEFNDTSVKLHRQWINATASGAFRTADLIANAVARRDVQDVWHERIGVELQGRLDGSCTIRLSRRQTGVDRVGPKSFRG